MNDTYTVVTFAGTDLRDSFRNLVLARWLRSLRRGNDYYKLIDQDAYFHAYQRYLVNLIGRPDTRITFAVLTDDPDVVLGFSVHRGKTLDYVHVQRHQRRQGIARALVPQGVEMITHVTRHGLPIWADKMREVKFNPFV